MQRWMTEEEIRDWTRIVEDYLEHETEGTTPQGTVPIVYWSYAPGSLYWGAIHPSPDEVPGESCYTIRIHYQINRKELEADGGFRTARLPAQVDLLWFPSEDAISLTFDPLEGLMDETI